MELYKGYVPTSNKKSQISFKDKSSSELLSLDEARRYNEFAGILADDVIMVDIDDEEQSQKLLKIVRAKGLKCKVLATTRGCHFLFKCASKVVNTSHTKIAIGLTVDIKGSGRASYEVLKFNGVEREVLYDSGEYELLPKYLHPVKTKMDLLGLCEGDGRNNALFSYILPLQQNRFTVAEIKECISIINEFVLSEPLPDEELKVILRDGAFEKPSFFTSKGAFLFDEFAKYLAKSDNLIKINGELHIYQDGVYRNGGEIIERAIIKHIPSLSKAKRAEVLAYLNLLVPLESSLSNVNLVAFNNGVLNVADYSFSDFSPEYIVTNKIPHNYNPEATDKLLDQVMNKLACNDSNVLKLLYQSVGYCFYRRNELRKSFFLLGEKRNGKSTFLGMINNLLGEANTSNLDLCEIGDKFLTAELAQRLINIGDDINDDWISNTAVFKKVVSGELVTAQRKNDHPFKLRSFAKFFFSANNIPRLGRGRDSGAILDRLVIIPFNAKFTKADPDYDPFIKDKLATESVMEALIAKAIPALREVLINQEFQSCEKVIRSLKEFELSNNPILQFFDELEENDYLREEIKLVYRKYNTFCLSNNVQALSASEFQRQIKLRFDLTVKLITRAGKKVRIYDRGGIGE